MKIIVISDTHGALNDAVDVISACRIGCGAVLHLGDVARDFEHIKNAFPEIPFVGVAGNNDFFNNSLDKECLLNLDGVNIFMCHGHEYGVKRGLDNLIWRAEEKNADIALYGHTHEASKETFDNILLFNPGAMKDGQFGIIHTHNGKIASADFHRLDRLTRKII